MSTETHHDPGQPACPLCTLWTAYRNSDARQHMRNIQRESLLLARGVVSACVHALEEHRAPKAPKPGYEPPEG